MTQTVWIPDMLHFAAALPDYSYDKDRGVYLDPRGNEVSHSEIMRLLEQEIEAHYDRMAELLRGVAWQSPALLEASVMMDLKFAYLQNAALGAGGWANLTFSDYGKIGAWLRSEYGYLRGFLDEVLNGELSEAQILARIDMYLGAARATVYEIEGRHLVAQDGYVWLERRILRESDRTCEDCVIFAGMGWQRIGVLPPPGRDSQCRGNCKCDLERHQWPIHAVQEAMLAAVFPV